jgi:hypothetical protein
MSGGDNEVSMEGLRTEIIESQKTQADFLKWKLISVAAVASISLGLAPTGGTALEGAKLLMCLVPLVCAYVDLISLHLMIRILTIGIYLKNSGDPYEKFVFGVREKTATNPFVFEAVAMLVSSGVFDATIVALGFALPKGPGNWPSEYLAAYIVSGVLGIVATIAFWLMHSSRTREVIRVGESDDK